MIFCGYETMTTFYEDFTIADMFGIDAIKDTYKRAFAEWKDDYKYLTELVMVLNWKMWAHYKDNKEYAELYEKLYYETAAYATETLKGEELSYYYATTD